ncbi:cell division protein FtsL [Vibrio sp. CAU 1672]|uniref:cell division protein FtsL n=1 Tax=Vibrio sp. CAU 1672 TaxID=3032594 RepID=UPI0023DACBA3|nr:cell division protein FtsL [Vibrio sp. CAU 1672]MDF2153311.1 cell division protein FtsL [Vibrio sp. CAU 1672]
MTQASPNLTKLIARDLITVGRIPLLLLLMIFGSAMGTVLATHHARQAIAEKDQTLVERERLDSEWRNLMLEETALAEHSRVQDLAKKDLEMKRPDGDKEVVITLK